MGAIIVCPCTMYYNRKAFSRVLSIIYFGLVMKE